MFHTIGRLNSSAPKMVAFPQRGLEFALVDDAGCPRRPPSPGQHIPIASLKTPDCFGQLAKQAIIGKNT
jgi:hypothetical protein